MEGAQSDSFLGRAIQHQGWQKSLETPQLVPGLGVPAEGAPPASLHFHS